MEVIRDIYGRTFRTLRVSLLNHCNLGCVYCVPEEEGKVAAVEKSALQGGALQGSAAQGGAGVPRGVTGPGKVLAVPDLLEIIGRLKGQLQLDTVRLTGGEPLLYPGLVELTRGLRTLGIPQIKLTTNGFLLERLAVPLKEAGMESVNVSLDAIDETIFARMSRRHSVLRIVRGIDAALSAGLTVKLNTVVMKGMNESQILPLLDFAFARHIRIRFLEVMAMGHLHEQAGRYLLSRNEILTVIAERYVLQPADRVRSATAHYWETQDGHSFGIIANESEPFCGDCDRLRLDSSGNIYGCLSSNHPIPLDRADSAEEWNGKLQQALLQKQTLRFTGSDLSMLQIGG